MGSHPLVLLLSPQLSNLLLPSHPKQMTLLLPHRKLRLLDEGSPSSHHPGLATILFSPMLQSPRPLLLSDISIGFSFPHHCQPQGVRFILWKTPVRKCRAETRS